MSLDPRQQATPGPPPETEATNVSPRQKTHARTAPTLAWIQSRVHDIYSAAKHLPPDNKSVTISMSAYTELYTAIFDYIVLNKKSSAHLKSEDLYRNLEREIQLHCSDVHHELFAKEIQGNDKDTNAAGRFLTAYVVQYERFMNLTKVVRNIFRFMERHWIKRELDEKRKDVYTIQDLHRKLWKEEILHIQKDELSTQELQALATAATVLRGKDGGMTTEEMDLLDGVVKSLSALRLNFDGCLEAT